MTGDAVIVTVRGDIDASTLSFFSDLMTEALALQGRSVTVDVAGLSFMDSQALHVLVSAAELARSTGATLRVHSATPQVYRTLHATGLLAVLGVAERPAQAFDVAATVAALSTLPRTRDVLDAALQLMVGTAQAVVVGADGASLTLPRNGALGTVAASNATVLEMDHDQYDTGEGPCLDAALQGRRFRIDTLSTETRWPTFVPRAQARGINSILSTPVTVGGAPLGALNLYSRTAGVFTDQDNQWANTFAHQAAVVLTAAEDSTSPGLQAEMTQALLSREVISLAQGMVMQRDRVSADIAHSRLRDLSRATSTPMRALAEQLVAPYRDLGPTASPEITSDDSGVQR